MTCNPPNTVCKAISCTVCRPLFSVRNSEHMPGVSRALLVRELADWQTGNRSYAFVHKRMHPFARVYRVTVRPKVRA